MRSLLMLCVAVSAWAADLTGVWVGTIPGRNGEPLDVSFRFTQTGSVLKGKLYGDYKSTGISETKIEGERISFVVLAEEQAGNEIMISRLKFTGTFKDGEMELTREREKATIVGSGAEMKFRTNVPVTFKLKRLI